MKIDNDSIIYNGETPIIKVYNGTNLLYEKNQKEYKELNYIEGTGNHQINTGYNPKSYTRVVIDFELTRLCPNTTGYNIFTATWTISGFAMIQIKVGDKNPFRWHNGGYADTNYSASVGERITMDVYRGTVKINGDVVLDRNMSASPNIPIKLFDYGSSYRAYYKLYNFKVYEYDELVHNFIPVLDKDNVACLYDEITQTYFYNQYTTPFLYG